MAARCVTAVMANTHGQRETGVRSRAASRTAVAIYTTPMIEF
jgi:hypothetical protein